MSFKIIKTTTVGLTSTKCGSMPAPALLIRISVRSTVRPAFLPSPKDWMSCVTCLQSTTAVTSAWNQPANTVPSQIHQAPEGQQDRPQGCQWICDLYICGIVRPFFILPTDIRELRDLVRYRFKLTCMITDENNRAHNCLTVSNFKLDFKSLLYPLPLCFNLAPAAVRCSLYSR